MIIQDNKLIYSGLHQKSKRRIHIESNPRVFFCCDDADFDKCFGPISDEIISIQDNVSVCYFHPGEEKLNNKELFSELSRMKMFVVPVTESFLYTDCHARTVELAYAIEHHIPVLPILQDKLLEDEFNRVCANIEFLENFPDSVRGLSYEKRMEKFLRSVILSNDLENKIRSSFDGYVFLAYRKKNYRYVQDIMRKIHSIDSCRDIAIWYDEFLTPGEDFNQGLENAIKQSDVLGMIVTPDLPEDDNYVITDEYPLAIQCGKKILPIEVTDTDRTRLEKSFPGIPESVKNSVDIENRLKEYLPGLGSKANDAEHSYYMGLAYLNGFDVEMDRERGLQLIQRSAELGFDDAYHRLVEMYRTGDGVARDYSKAIQWQETYVEVLEKNAAEHSDCTSTPDEAINIADIDNVFNATGDEKRARKYIALFNEIDRLGDFYVEQLQWDKVSDNYKKLENCGLEIVKCCRPDYFFYLCKSCIKIGDAYYYHKNLERAKYYYEEAISLAETLTEYGGSYNDYTALRVATQNMGNIYWSKGNMPDAKRYYKSALSICEALEYQLGHDEKRNRAILCGSLGGVCLKDADIPSSKNYYMSALQTFMGLVEEDRSVKNRESLAVCYLNVADMCLSTGLNPKVIIGYYKFGIDLLEELAEEIGTLTIYRELVDGYKKVIAAEEKLKRMPADSFYEGYVRVTGTLADKLRTSKALEDHAYALIDAFQALQSDISWLEKAMSIFRQLSNDFPDIDRYKKAYQDAELNYKLYRHLAKMFED